MMELPKLEDGVLYLGDSKLSFLNCDLDGLIEVFGEPTESYPIQQKEWFKVFRFDHPFGHIYAIVFFKDESAPIDFELSNFDLGFDRGILVELQLELDEAIELKKLGKPLRMIKQAQFEFVVLQEFCLARLLTSNEIDAIGFINPGFFKSPEYCFMFDLFFWHSAEFLKSFELMIEMTVEEEETKATQEPEP